MSEASGAAQLCGSCKGLVDELVTGEQTASRTPFASLIALLSLIALAGSLAILAAPPWPLTQSAGTSFQIDQLWTNGFWKQVTGFSLVALMAVANLLFLRKQSVLGVPGSYATWRLVHVGLGAAMLALLFLHTGLQLGQNLNSWLMVSVLATLTAGAVLGVATALEGRVGSRSGSAGLSLRRLSSWLHILVAWPLPLLLALHILMVYYF